MSSETCSTMSSETCTVEQQQHAAGNTEDRAGRRHGLFHSILRGLFWPLSAVVRAYRGFWVVLGFRQPQERALVSPQVLSTARHSLTGRKRLHRLTRLLLSILPRWAQGALGYPVSSSIGRSLSPEIRVSPTKPYGKGSKRKQDELDDEEDEEAHPTWVEALSQDLLDDEGTDEDPDYEPSTVETESEEYRSHNDTESDLEVHEKCMVIIEDVKDVEPPTSAQVSCPAV
uniref:oogenesis-related isoform X2 n=1 Tax=Monopterus albus TaxID=43700 RepID=UPI0009B44BE2|nr:uncharacterized protein LOC109974172 isoform X2 [Monopterus albus]